MEENTDTMMLIKTVDGEIVWMDKFSAGLLIAEGLAAKFVQDNRNYFINVPGNIQTR